MKSKFPHKNGNLHLKWKCDLIRPVIENSCLERKWTRVEDEDEIDCHFYWASVKNIKKIFNPKYRIRLKEKQILNHFPNHYELTRKDLLVKNLKRYRPQNKIITLVNGKKVDVSVNVIPHSYVLPIEYSIFLEEFTRSGDKKWIFKPAGRSQGKGIQIITKFTQAKGLPMVISQANKKYIKKDNFIISKYLDNPFLIGGRKFDLRTYVLVTNYKPLIVWVYREGFARVCFNDYEAIGKKTGSNPNNKLFSHLTNSSFQKYSPKYNDVHGGKWPLTQLFTYIELNYGKEKLAKLQREITRVYLTTLKSVQNVILNDKHCFELYGFDILIDSKLRPWLIEVNASPSMVSTTRTDFMLKKNIINDLLNILYPEDWFENKGSSISSSSREVKVGNFDLVYDESKDPLNNKPTRPKTSIKKSIKSKFYF